jgi:hypothetical protein
MSRFNGPAPLGIDGKKREHGKTSRLASTHSDTLIGQRDPFLVMATDPELSISKSDSLRNGIRLYRGTHAKRRWIPDN